MNMTRKDFLKTAGACALGAVGTAAGASAPVAGTETGRAKVYFSSVIDSDHLNKLHDLIKGNLSGKIAIKLHTGESRSQHPAARNGEVSAGTHP